MEEVKLPVDGKCSYCGSEIAYCVAGEYCSNSNCGYIDGYYRPYYYPKKTTYADLRKKDPAIRAILQCAIGRNIQHPEIEAIEKILVEGADGRYLAEVNPEDLPMVAVP